MKLNLDKLRLMVARTVNKEGAIGQYWELLALASRDTGHTVKELHDLFSPLRKGLLTNMNQIEFRDYVGTVIIVLAENGIDVQLNARRLSLWA